MQFLRFLKKTFSFDDRSMGLYRILVGLIVACDVIYRWRDIENLYSDVGLVPRSLFLNEMAMPWSFSLHMANGTYTFGVIMFSIHLLLAVMVIFGYKSRVAQLGLFVMAVSIHNRNWLVNNGGDDVLRVILFLSVFLPLNRRFSIDSALEKEQKETTDYFSMWVQAFFFQVFAIYFVSYILKDHAIWRKDFTAVAYSSRLDIFATSLAIWLRGQPFIMKVITAASIYLEWFGPILLYFSFAFGRFWWVIRLFLVVAFIGFHFGIFLTMNIGLFTFICMIMWTIFIPGPLWDTLGAHFKKKNYDKLTIYYDGECGFCQKAVRILKSFLLFKDVPLKVAQETVAIHEDMTKNLSWVIVNENNERFFHYSAWIELLKHSPVGRPFVGFFSLKPVSYLGGRVYHWVSHNRPLMGKASQFLDYVAPKKEIKTIKWLVNLLGAFFLITLIMWNLSTIKKFNIKSEFFSAVTRWTHIYQEWNMFAPYPKTDNVWIEIPAVLSDDSEIELLTGNRDVYSIKDQEFVKSIPSEKWRKFYLNVTEKIEYSRYFGGYLCRLWNDRKKGLVKGVTLRKMEINVYSQVNLPTGDKGGIVKKLSWKHWCFDEDYKKENLQR
jgi:predicted DCC family thiol-disulfide oxidoreductase YuxK